MALQIFGTNGGGGTGGSGTDPNAVPKSTVTAKGDLIVGTGSGTVARKAAGANGKLVAYDSSTATGLTDADGVALAQSGQTPSQDPASPGTAAVGSLAFAARADHVHPIAGPSVTYRAGRFYDGAISTGLRFTAAFTPGGSGSFYTSGYLFTPTKDITVVSLGLKVTTAGAAGAKVRAGLFSADPNTYNLAAVLGDSGDLIATATGMVSATLTTPVVLRAGTPYWAGWQYNDGTIGLQKLDALTLPFFGEDSAGLQKNGFFYGPAASPGAFTATGLNLTYGQATNTNGAGNQASVKMGL